MTPQLNYMVVPGIPKIRKPEDIIKQVCEALNVDPDQVTNKEKKGKRKYSMEVYEARYICSYLILKKFKIGCVKQAEIFNKDHATILHGLKIFDQYMEKDKPFQEKFARVSAHINI